jgi:frataxin-like iron-binding protein CyaY
MKKKIFAVAILAVLIAVFAGVKIKSYFFAKSSEKMAQELLKKAIEAQSGTQASVDIEEDKMVIKTESEDGSAIAINSQENQLPENFPEDIFILDAAKIIYSSSYEAQESVFALTYYTEKNPLDVFSAYKEKMAENGWEKDNEINMENGEVLMLNFTKGGKNVVVNISIETDTENAGKTIVGISQSSQ